MYEGGRGRGDPYPPLLSSLSPPTIFPLFKTQLVLQATSAKGLLVPIVVIFSIIALPIVFHIVASFEKYKTHSSSVTMTLIRSAVVRIATLIVYIFSAYAAIQCTQDTSLQVPEFSVRIKNNTIPVCIQVSG